MRLIHHVLLAATRIPKHLAAEEAKVTELHTLCNIGQKTLERGHTVNIEDIEGVLVSHVVEALLDST